jgi:Flp pilus assembly protein TadD
MAQRQLPSAISFLKNKITAHENDPKTLSVLYELYGSVLLAAGDFETSEAAFNKALSLSPDMVAPYLSLARLYLTRKETSRAIEQYRELLEKRPSFIQAHMAMGAIYDATGETDKARQAYEKALEVQPGFAPAANNLAWLLLQQGQDPDRALALAKQAKSHLPDDPAVADTMGLAYLAKGLFPSAVAELSDAAAKMPDNPTILYHLGLALWKSNQKDQALATVKKALAIEETFPEQGKAKALLLEIEAS